MTDEKPKLLIIEDDAVLAKAMNRSLTREGYDVTVSPNHEAAEVMVSNQTFDAIVSDIDTKHGNDGIKFGEKLRKGDFGDENKDAAIIYHTGGHSAAEVAHIDNSEFVNKPGLDEVVQHLQNIAPATPGKGQGRTP